MDIELALREREQQHHINESSPILNLPNKQTTFNRNYNGDTIIISLYEFFLHNIKLIYVYYL